MTAYVTAMPVKSGGKIVPPNSPAGDGPLDDERKRLLGLGIIREADGVTEGEQDADAFDLADALATAISVGHDVPGMNMDAIHKLLGADGDGVKRADVDAALATIKTDDD